MTAVDFFKQNTIPGILYRVDGNKLNVSGIPNPTSGHKYLSFTGPRTGMVSEVSLKLTNQYLPKMHTSIKKWRDEKRKFHVNNPVANSNSKAFNYLDISEHIRINGYFDARYFNLHNPHECWLDHSNNLKMDFHRQVNGRPWITFSDHDLKKIFHGKITITPRIGREGIELTSFFESIIDRVIRERIELVENSELCLTMGWLFSLKNLVNDTISSIDILLNTIYTKAEYDPPSHWKPFDKNKLGEKHGRRLTDKLKWVYQLSGNHLDISKEKPSLMFLKDLRNHLNHFDPPCFAATIEEMADWLNMVIDIAIIHVKIREALSMNVSNLLFNFILQPVVNFVPEQQSSDRSIQDRTNEGYNTSTWNSQLEKEDPTITYVESQVEYG